MAKRRRSSPFAPLTAQQALSHMLALQRVRHQIDGSAPARVVDDTIEALAQHVRWSIAASKRRAAR